MISPITFLPRQFNLHLRMSLRTSSATLSAPMLLSVLANMPSTVSLLQPPFRSE